MDTPKWNEGPLKFRKVEAGRYRSACERYEIRLTTLRGVRLHGRSSWQWRTFDIVRGRQLDATHGSGAYELTLEDAVHKLYRTIAHGFFDGFSVFVRRQKDIDTAARAAAAYEGEIAAVLAEIQLDGAARSEFDARRLAKRLVDLGWVNRHSTRKNDFMPDGVRIET